MLDPNDVQKNAWSRDTELHKTLKLLRSFPAAKLVETFRPEKKKITFRTEDKSNYKPNKE